jgi:hypothetical protein
MSDKDDDAAWSVLETWLATPEWAPSTAAYLLVGLDPEQTEGPSAEQGLGAFWLPDSKPTKFGEDRHSLEQNTPLAIDRMLRLVEAADPIKVRTPKQWLRWSCSAQLEPPWLKAALGRNDLLPLLPANLPARKNNPRTASLLASQVSRLGGEAKFAKTVAWRAKVLIELRINVWLSEVKSETMTAYAERLLDILAAEMPYEAAKDLLPGHATILRWIRKQRKSTTL